MKATRFAFLIAALAAFPIARAHAAAPIIDSVVCPDQGVSGVPVICTVNVRATTGASLTVVPGPDLLPSGPTLTIPYAGTFAWPLVAMPINPTTIPSVLKVENVTSNGVMLLGPVAPAAFECGTGALVSNETRTCRVTLASPPAALVLGGLRLRLDPSLSGPSSVDIPANADHVDFPVTVVSGAPARDAPIRTTTSGGDRDFTIRVAGTIATSTIMCDRTELHDGETSTCKVNLSAQTNDQVPVALTSDSAALVVPAMLLATDGTAEFTVTAAAIGASGTAHLTASSGGGSATAQIHLATPGTLTALHCDDTALRPGDTTWCTLDAKEAVRADIDVHISTDAALSAPALVTIRRDRAASDQFVVTAKAASSGVVTLTATYDGVSFDEPFTVSAGSGSFPGGGGGSGSGGGGGYRPTPDDGSVGGCSTSGPGDAIIPALMLGVLALLSWRRRARR